MGRARRHMHLGVGYSFTFGGSPYNDQLPVEDKACTSRAGEACLVE